MARRVLVSWIGSNDLRAMAVGLPAAEQAELLKEVGSGAAAQTEGPIRTLTSQETFDETHLLSNYPARWNSHFAKWLGSDSKVHRVKLNDPTDYDRVFRITDDFLKQLAIDKKAGHELCIHLSPGTPTMTAIWVLLGKSRFPAKFYQTYQGKVWETLIPFDLVVDYIPEVLRDADATLQHLAASMPAELPGFEAIVGESRAIREAAGRAKLAAGRSVSVLIVGESGTGKELFARAIHEASRRGKGPFLAVNCAAFPRDLLEAELFGYEKGAFTGATSARPGLFERADGGTLFLDEVGDCDPAMQVKLLRVLQTPPAGNPCIRSFQRLGGSAAIEGDVRIVAATNCDLVTAIQERRFREDLYYRLAAVTLKLPPLRERKGDIPSIATELIRQINEFFRRDEPGYRDKSLSDSAIEFVRRHPWPGNVRQLYNTLVQAAVLGQGATIERRDCLDAVIDVPSAAVHPLEHSLGSGFNLQEHLNSIHGHYLRRAMQEANGVKSNAAKLLGMDNYQTLDAQLKRLKIRSRPKP